MTLSVKLQRRARVQRVLMSVRTMYSSAPAGKSMVLLSPDLPRIVPATESPKRTGNLGTLPQLVLVMCVSVPWRFLRFRDRVHREARYPELVALPLRPARGGGQTCEALSFGVSTLTAVSTCSYWSAVSSGRSACLNVHSCRRPNPSSRKARRGPSAAPRPQPRKAPQRYGLCASGR